MAKAEDLSTKLYYFSVFFGEAQRAFNWAWRPELHLVQLVTQTVYGMIQARVNEMQSGTDRGVIGIPKDFLPAITEAGRDLANLFQEAEVDDAGLMAVLTKIANLGYATTGNGKYLMIRGQLNLDVTTAPQPPSSQSPDAASR